MTKTIDEIIAEIDQKIFQDSTGEKCDGWLAIKNGIFIDGEECCKIATPDDIKNVLRSALLSYGQSEREKEKNRIAKKLVKIEKEKWKDEEHCTCLGYAIVTIFGEKYEEQLKSKK